MFIRREVERVEWTDDREAIMEDRYRAATTDDDITIDGFGFHNIDLVE